MADAVPRPRGLRDHHPRPPVLPFYATSFGASPQLVTLLSTAYSLAQFGAAPLLGRISDRVGRRPVMLISIAGSCASMLVLGFAGALWMVFVARVLSGLSTANISTAHAYVADRVAPAPPPAWCSSASGPACRCS